jgi:hypothetical protein
MPLVDHRLIADATTRNLPDVLTQGSMTRTLIGVLRLSPGEAARRIRAGVSCRPPVSTIHKSLATRR